MPKRTESKLNPLLRTKRISQLINLTTHANATTVQISKQAKSTDKRRENTENEDPAPPRLQVSRQLFSHEKEHPEREIQVDNRAASAFYSNQPSVLRTNYTLSRSFTLFNYPNNFQGKLISHHSDHIKLRSITTQLAKRLNWCLLLTKAYI
jgi:hypothetical protein